MTNRFLEKVNEKTLFLDGAMGSMLMAAGLTSGDAPELWNTKKPSVIMDIHKRYYDAGSDVVITNTFGGSSLKLADTGLAEKMKVLNLEAAKNAKKVCPDGKFVAGDLGPTGKMLKPLGDVDPEVMEAAFYEQALALLEGGVDCLIVETMFSLDEALLAVKAAKKAGDAPVIGSITYDRKPKGFFTMMGETPAACAAALVDAGADVVGANCTLGSKDMIDLTRELGASTRKPILVQPNAGKPITRKGVTHYEQTTDEFADDGKKIIEAGANLIGGCCGTNPDFIQALVEGVGVNR